MGDMKGRKHMQFLIRYDPQDHNLPRYFFLRTPFSLRVTQNSENHAHR